MLNPGQSRVAKCLQILVLVGIRSGRSWCYCHFVLFVFPSRRATRRPYALTALTGLLPPQDAGKELLQIPAALREEFRASLSDFGHDRIIDRLCLFHRKLYRQRHGRNPTTGRSLVKSRPYRRPQVGRPPRPPIWLPANPGNLRYKAHIDLWTFFFHVAACFMSNRLSALMSYYYESGEHRSEDEAWLLFTQSLELRQCLSNQL